MKKQPYKVMILLTSGQTVNQCFEVKGAALKVFNSIKRGLEDCNAFSFMNNTEEVGDSYRDCIRLSSVAYIALTGPDINE